MEAAKSRYLVPNTLEEACEMLAGEGPVVILAGGTDLLLNETWKCSGVSVLSTRKLEELKVISKTETELVIGSGVTMADLEHDPTIRECAPFLSRVVAKLASPQIRNVATVGGNICNAAPSADIVPALLVADASFVLVSCAGSRTVPANEFFTGPSSTVMKKSEILESIRIPLPSPRQIIYIKSARRNEMDIATVGVAVGGDYDPATSSFSRLRVAFGAVAPIPLRGYEVEEFLAGKKIDKKLIEEAASLSAKIVSPISNIRASEDHRRLLIEVYTKRILLHFIGERDIEGDL